MIDKNLSRSSKSFSFVIETQERERGEGEEKKMWKESKLKEGSRKCSLKLFNIFDTTVKVKRFKKEISYRYSIYRKELDIDIHLRV